MFFASLGGKNVSFSFSTIQDFDRHILNSVPGYSRLVNYIVNLSDYFVQCGEKIFDIGCSTGMLVKKLSRRHPRCDIYGIDSEENFIGKLENTKNTSFFRFNAADMNFTKAAMITSVFTLQFIRPVERLNLIKSVHDGLNSGGAFILAEKIYSVESRFQDIATFLYYDFKSHAFAANEILSKERSLRKIMKPKTLNENTGMLMDVGFVSIEMFWRELNFCALLCIKE